MMGNSNQLVGDNKFTLFPILGVERSFPFPGKVATGKGPFLSQERLQLGKVSAILGKVKDPFLPFLSQNGPKERFER